MNNKQNTNNCYVFSQTTLDLALQEWLRLENQIAPDEEETKQIVLVAAPWFIKHLKQPGPTYMFTYDILISEMDAWTSLQIEEYPHQQQRIEETSKLLIEFFQSELMIKYKMMINA